MDKREEGEKGGKGERGERGKGREGGYVYVVRILLLLDAAVMTLPLTMTMPRTMILLILTKNLLSFFIFFLEIS